MIGKCSGILSHFFLFEDALRLRRFFES
jgi:hypothetical protein